MSINFHERLMCVCVFFWHKVVSKRYAYHIIKQHEKVAFPRRQDNQACWMRRSRHNLGMPPPSCSFLHLFCFLLEVARLCNLFIIQIRCRNPRIVFAEKGRGTKIVRRKWKIEKNNKEQVQFTTIKWKREHEGAISAKNEKRHSPGYSSMSLNKQSFEPIPPYFSLPHLLAQFSVVNIL